MELMILPPHSSHLTQSLNIALFGLLKRFLSNAVYQLVGVNLFKLTKSEWLQCYIPVRIYAFTSSLTLKATGLKLSWFHLT